MKPYILITNDDGIQAPGIRHLWEAAREFADVTIVAPHTEKSGSGLAITWTKPLHIREFPWENNVPAYSLNGTPVDCVRMALSVILPRPPTLILSGVNRGSNSGRTVFYSGTVGGVIEGALRNIPGIAFSYSDFAVPPLSATKAHMTRLIKHFLDHPIPSGSILNVTFPPHCEKLIRGFRMARQGKGYWIENPEQRIHPEGIPYYWLGGKWLGFEEDPESDVALLEQGYITAVPIQIVEMTDHSLYHKHKDALEKLTLPPVLN